MSGAGLDELSREAGTMGMMRPAGELAREHLSNARALRFKFWPKFKPSSVKCVGVFPYPLKNPFMPLLYSNWQTQVAALPSLGRGIRLARSGHLDALHIHFEDQVTRRTRFEPTLYIEQAAQKAIKQLADFQAHGGSIAWTLHNAESHYEKSYPKPVKELRLFLAKNAQMVHVFNEAGELNARDILGTPSDRIVRIAHPSYFGGYDNIPTVKPPEERRRFLCFGTILPFKGIGEFLEAVGHADVDQSCGRIMVAGQRWGLQSLDLARQVPANRQVELSYALVPDKKVSSLFRNTDFAVLNYQRNLTSGVAALAMTMGTPVIGTSIGGMLEAVPPENHQLLCSPNDPDGLIRVIERACRMSADEHGGLQKACRAFAQRIHPLKQSSQLERAFVAKGLL